MWSVEHVVCGARGPWSMGSVEHGVHGAWDPSWVPCERRGDPFTDLSEHGHSVTSVLDIGFLSLHYKLRGLKQPILYACISVSLDLISDTRILSSGSTIKKLAEVAGHTACAHPCWSEPPLRWLGWDMQTGSGWRVSQDWAL